MLVNLVRGNSETANKLATAKKIELSGAVSGNANFDGSGNITISTTQANIAILTGTIDITMTKDLEQVYFGTKSINYPTGYTANNSIVIAIGTRVNENNKCYGYGSVTGTGTALNRGTIEKGITLTDSNLLLCCRFDGLDLGGTASETQTISMGYKIVLMKVS